MNKLKVEIADTPLKREYGLMDRKSMADNSGMLFKFPHAHYLSFWMKNTYIPLDIAFLDDNGRILQIEKMYPLSTRAIRADYMCKYALEVPSGWFDKNNVAVGSLIIGEGLTHRRGKCITAQGFMGKLKNVWDKWVKPKDPKDKVVSKPEDKKSKEDKETLEPPEAAPEGEYPTTVPMEPMGPFDPNIPMEPTQEGANPEVEYLRDMRGKIRFAEKHGLPMEIIYWTLNGHMLPPRKVQPLEGEGYPIKSGRSGEYLVAFDISPTISGGDGWSIKGMQPKSFILDNIINLALIDQNGQEIPPETVAQLKAQEKGQAPQQPQQPQQTQPQQAELTQQGEQPQKYIPKNTPIPLNPNKPMPTLQRAKVETKELEKKS